MHEIEAEAKILATKLTPKYWPRGSGQCYMAEAEAKILAISAAGWFMHANTTATLTSRQRWCAVLSRHSTAWHYEVIQQYRLVYVCVFMC